MGKFKFSDYTPANVAKPAKVLDGGGYTSANNLLKFAKVEYPKQECSSTLAKVSNTLANQEPFKTNNLSNISNFSRGQGLKPEKTYQQEHYELWLQANKLADWIDDSNSEIPWQERTARVPELQEMAVEIDLLIDVLETQIKTGFEIMPDGEKKYKGLDGVWYPYKAKLQPEDEAVKPEKCPASCKQTGRCYSTTWFTGKPGPFPGPVCSDTTDCIWIETGKHEEMKR